MIAAAAEKDRVLVANLMQRYNPLSDVVKRLIDSKVLGEVLHGYFENYAGDEKLGPNHWFWDPNQSGGIFIEHVVHFFDLFEKWLGPGEVVAAQASTRPGTDLEDQVQCTVRYRDGIHVNHYHGFTQSNHMDRQELRILFERGDLTLYEWVPTRAGVRCVVDDAGLDQLADLFPGAEVTVVAEFDGDDLSDVVVGAIAADTGGTDAGAVYVFTGSVLAGSAAFDVSDADAAILGEGADDLVGGEVAAGVGLDLEGDGTDDLLANARGYDGAATGAGRVALFLTDTLWSASSHDLSDADYRFDGETAGAYAGWSSAGGDVDGDGVPDLVVGAIVGDGAASESGLVYVLFAP